MSKQTKANPKGNAASARVRKPGARDVVTIVSAAAIGLLLGFGWWKVQHAAPQPSAPVPQIKANNQPVDVGEYASEFQKLKGKWVRPDGGYVIEVRSVEQSGQMDASYSNPQSINVAKAEASQDGASIRMFMELRDTNYPGSTYDLTYDPQRDELNGVYYQAALQKRFTVTFVRMRN